MYAKNILMDCFKSQIVVFYIMSYGNLPPPGNRRLAQWPKQHEQSQPQHLCQQQRALQSMQATQQQLAAQQRADSARLGPGAQGGLALARADAVMSGGVMLAFGLGTLPLLFSIGVAGTAMQSFLQRPRVRLLAGALVLAFGVLGLVRVGTGLSYGWLDSVCITPGHGR